MLSHHVIDHVVINREFASSMQHQIRWMKSTRCSRRAGHAGTALTFAMPFGIRVCWAQAPCTSGRLVSGCSRRRISTECCSAVVAGWGVVRDPRALRMAWLYPLRDLMGFLFWCASYSGRTIVWRGDRYRLEGCGRMVLVEPGAAATVRRTLPTPISPPVRPLPTDNEAM